MSKRFSTRLGALAVLLAACASAPIGAHPHESYATVMVENRGSETLRIYDGPTLMGTVAPQSAKCMRLRPQTTGVTVLTAETVSSQRRVESMPVVATGRSWHWSVRHMNSVDRAAVRASARCT